MEPNRKRWNETQKTLRGNLGRGQNYQASITLFLEQHIMVHSSQMTQSDLWSFADEIWEDITDESFRHIPQSEDYSIAWIIWHIARIEDITMNMLVAGTPQLVDRDHWLERIKSPVIDTGNAMDVDAVRQFSVCVDGDALRAYRQAVGRRTREIVMQLTSEHLKQRVAPERLQQVLDEGAVVEEARGIVDYWSKRTVAGLLLMPPTRHNMIHINQALRIKNRRV